MFVRRLVVPLVVGASVLAISSCSADDSVSGPATFVPTAETKPTTAPASSAVATTDPPTNDPPTTDPTNSDPSATDPPTTDPPTTDPPTTDPTSSDPTATGPTNTDPIASDPSTTSTIAVAPLPVFEPSCVVEVAAGESLSLIADRFDDETVTVPAIRTENGIVGDNIDPGDYIDVCVANGIDDITGEQRTEADAAEAATLVAVEAQQRQLNVLFAGLGTPELLVDGISGPVTRQRLCAARVAFGLPVSTTEMIAGSEEEAILMAATVLPIPFTSAILSPRWILIDRTCQIMFAGEGSTRLTLVFPTSTGEPGFETRDQDLARAFRFNPALANGGWHNSTTYPVAEDNPLNGNMYKPLYFDNGQAIHGANNVPTNPQSKGCARLRVEHQEALIAWLGLGDITTETRSRDRINVTVNVQGTYIPT